MYKQSSLRQSSVALAVGFFGLIGSALAVNANEVEPNNWLASSQQLSDASDPVVMKDGATVSGTITAPSPMPDMDFYSFYGTKDQKLSLHIQDTGTFNAVLTLVGPGPGYEVKAEKYVEFQGQQVRLEDVLLDQTGVWAVVVSPHKFLIARPDATTIGELVATGSRPIQPFSGSYTLVITPTAPPVRKVTIKIKPGSNERAPINPKAKGNIPVALVASDDFDPFDVDLESLTFGATGDEPSFSKCAGGGLDVNGDGRRDRLCTFENDLANFNSASTMAFVKGKTRDGRLFEGQGVLKALPVPVKGTK